MGNAYVVYICARKHSFTRGESGKPVNPLKNKIR